MERLDIKHMRIFLHLIREKNVSKVAAKTGVSQQAVSIYLKRLRSIFPVELFLRKNSGLQPTDYAYELAYKFEKILLEVDDLFTKTLFEPFKVKVKISVMANEYAQLTIIPMWLNLIRNEAPNISVEVVDFNFKTHSIALENGDVDMVIGFSQHFDDSLVKRNLIREHYCCVVRKSSEFVGVINKTNHIIDFPVVNFSLSTGNIEDIVSDFLDDMGLNENIIATLPCYTTLPAFMKINDVIAFIPSAISSIGDYRVIAYSDSYKEFDIAAGWHRRSTGNSLTKWLTQKLVDSLS